MVLLKDLELAAKEDLIDFVNSFDYVCFDIDGVLQLSGASIPGAEECLSKLRTMGKKIIFASNNSITLPETLKMRLNKFEATVDEIMTPNESLLDYLQDINFLGDVYVIGGNGTKVQLRNAGYNVVEFEKQTIQESIVELRDECLLAHDKAQDVGAIVLDFDLNFNMLKAQRAINMLIANEDILLFSGARDEAGPLSTKLIALGPNFYIEAIERATKRTSIQFAKPSVLLKDGIQQKYDIDNLKRVLFVGDNAHIDMDFANKSGFQSLLVLSGITRREDVVDWSFPDEYKPDYYVTSLKEMFELLTKHDIK